MTQAAVLWLRVCWQQAHACLYSVDTAAYCHQNQDILQNASYSSEPRSGATHAPRLAHCVAVSALCGLCDALSLSLGPSAGDAHVLLLAAFALSRRRARFAVAVLMMYVYLSLPVPMVHGIIRSAVTVLATVLAFSLLPLKWATVRAVSASIVACVAGGATCSHKLGALSPALVLSVGLYDFRANPVIVLVLAVVILLWQ